MMSDEPLAPEPPGELWGLWARKVDDRWVLTIRCDDRTDLDRIAAKDPGKYVVAPIGVHPGWRERALAAEALLDERAFWVVTSARFNSPAAVAAFTDRRRAVDWMVRHYKAGGCVQIASVRIDDEDRESLFLGLSRQELAERIRAALAAPSAGSGEGAKR